MEFITSLYNLSEYDSGVVSDFNRMLILVATVCFCIGSILGILYIIKKIIFFIYIKCTNEKVQNALTSVIYELDKIADEMSNKQKRDSAIDSVRDLFIWRAIPIPRFIIGIIIDLEVAAIRRCQASIANTKDPYLHPNDEEESIEDNKSQSEENDSSKDKK